MSNDKEMDADPQDSTVGLESTVKLDRRPSSGSQEIDTEIETGSQEVEVDTEEAGPSVLEPLTLVGRKIRQFRILESLGEGGMGDVYLGFDKKLNRKVALKALRAEHRLRPEAKARLLREARILSKLDHPHICRIYDFVDEGEIDLLVLELIDGRSLRSHLKEGLSPDRCMEVACQMADVLVAGHGHGIVHRDLKPENVMITVDGEVKVLDFGIARSIQSSDPMAAFSGIRSQNFSGVATIIQEEEDGQITGTIAYMSPEQARGEVSTAASDMYSFGLLLQELFTGRRAYAAKNPAMLISEVSQAKTLLADGIDPDLSEAIERLKAFEPGARPAAIDIADRLRWIQDKPKRLRRRHWTIAAMAFLLCMSAFMAFLLVRVGQEADRANAASELALQEAHRANQEASRAGLEAERANQEAMTAREVSEFLVGLFEVSDPYGTGGGSKLTAAELLEQGALKIENELEDQPLTQARLMGTIGEVYYKIGELDRSLELQRRTLTLWEKHLSPDHPELAKTFSRLATVHRFRAEFVDAERLYLKSIPIFEKSTEERLLAEDLTNLGTLYWYQERPEEATDVLRRAEVIYRESGASGEGVAKTYQALAFLDHQAGRSTQARKLFIEAMDIQERLLGPEHPDLSFTLNGLGLVELDQGRYEASEEMLQRALAIRREALGPEHPMVAWILNGLGDLSIEKARWEQAAEFYRDAREIAGDPPNRALAAFGLARIDTAQGRGLQAQPLYAEARKTWEETYGPEHPGLALFFFGEAEFLRSEGKLDEAAILYEKAIALRGKNGQHPQMARYLNGYGDLHLDREDLPAAREYYERAQKLSYDLLRPGHPVEAHALHGLGGVARGEGRLDDAGEMYRRALVLRENTYGDEHPLTVTSRNELAQVSASNLR